MAATSATSFYNFLPKSRELEGNLHHNGLRSKELRLVKKRQIGSTRLQTVGFSCPTEPKQRSVKRVMASLNTIASAPKREKDPKKRVVVTGMGLVSVFGNNVDTFYNKLLEGESGVGLIDKFNTSEFPLKFAAQIRDFSSIGYIDEKTDLYLDDCWRYCLVAGKRSIQDANLVPETLKNIDRSRVGVIVGSGVGGSSKLCDGLRAIARHDYNCISEISIPKWTTDVGSSLLAMESGFRGPNYSITTACATSTFCIYAAANHIRAGEADIMLAGGTECGINPYMIGGFLACQALSKRNDEPQKASRPWDINRDGFVMGEGAGVLIMESLAHARKRGANILAEYLGGAITCDAHHLTNPHPEGLAVSSCITKALENARVSPEEVNYVNAHATSTPVGDLAEINGLKKVFKDTSEMKINATKSMIGHATGACGALEAIAVIKAIQSGWLHPTINQYNLMPEVTTFDTVPNKKKQHEVNVAISNSFGFGGHNAVIALAPFTLGLNT